MRARRRAAFTALVLGLVLISAEAAARVDDWWHFSVPVLANPDRDHDLTVRDDHGIHGRPHGRYRKWQLNAFGFRGPEISLEPPPQRTRLMVLGASETFGLYESTGKEYPAQLADALRERSQADVEVVNASMAGITLCSLLPYWERWASRFRPHVVLVYPSPLLYLDDQPPKALLFNKDPEAPVRSRFLGRLKDMARRSDLVRRARVELLVATGQSRRGSDWFFHTPPHDRLEQFVTDLDRLIASIQARGALPVLVTHACRSASPPRPEDRDDLQAMRVFLARPTPEVMVHFEELAREAVRDVGRRRHVTVIDAAAAMNANRAWFADLVHFNDAGAAVFAGLLADGLRAQWPRLSESRYQTAAVHAPGAAGGR